MLRFLLILALFLQSQLVLAWGRHDLLTQYALKDVQWLRNFDKIRVTPFKKFLKKVFSENFTEKEFLKQYQLNERTINYNFFKNY